MYFVYILKSKKFKRLYLGYSCNFQKRFKEHNRGMVQATRPYLPWKIVYYEAYFSNDGMDDYVEVADSPSLNPTDAITIEA